MLVIYLNCFFKTEMVRFHQSLVVKEGNARCRILLSKSLKIMGLPRDVVCALAMRCMEFDSPQVHQNMSSRPGSSPEAN